MDGEALSPSSWNPQDGLVIYTYTEPKLNNSITMTRTEQHANQDNKFTLSGINNRSWSSYENEFQTHYRIKRGSADYTGWSNLGNISSWSRTATEMRSLVPKANDGQDITIQFRRYNPSANWYSSNQPTKTFKVYYRPRIAISSASYRKNSSSGDSISAGQTVSNDSSLTGVYISWSYDTTQATAGYTQGYRIRLYNKDGTVVKTYYTTSKNYTIPKADIPRMQETKIDITAYYCNDTTDKSNYWYYNASTITKLNFIKLVSDLEKPVITYPASGSNWINNDFRICFQLPADPDKGGESETYVYENVEVMINNYTIRWTDSAGTTTTGTTVKNQACFSCNTLTYQRKVVVYPNIISGFPTSTGYTIKVRVKKKYHATQTLTKWSAWSDAVTLNITVPTYSVTAGQKILASHYNNLKAVVDRMRKTYKVSWTVPSNVTAGTTIILRTQYNYSTLLTKLNEIKTTVNGYGTFDKTNIRFDKDNKLITSFTTYQELVTAAENRTNEPNGRNYIQITYTELNKLK